MTARSGADGSFALDLPAGDHRLTVSGPGIVERTTTIRAPNVGLALDVIPAGGPWNLDFYREIARNGGRGRRAGTAHPLGFRAYLLHRRPARNPRPAPRFRPRPSTSCGRPSASRLPLLSGGRFRGERIEVTREPPADMTPGTVILRWNAAEVSERAETANAFAYRVGGDANVVVFRHIPETWAVHHEIGHVMGLYHPLGGLRPSHMWYSGELEPPHFTEWDIFHAQVVYARPAGNTDVDVDPPGFVVGGIPAAAGGAGRTRRLLLPRTDSRTELISGPAGSAPAGPRPGPRAPRAATLRSPARSGWRRRAD